jgi:UDP-N-acetylmuramoyl-L-alanyl-D-glutamate--2,6-diaminopimelate ligase
LGVTGTNGKTTVTWLIRSILQAAGKQTGLLGTVEYHDGVEVASADLTTPNSKPLFTWLAKMVRRGTTHVAMELSSHALDQSRADGLTLHSVVVTNVTQDHFDYHGDFQTYLAAKANILALCRSGGQVVLNADDHGSKKLFDQVPADSNLCTFGIDNEADVSAQILDETHSGCRFELCIDGNRQEVLTPLIGRHNVSNCLAAAAATYHAGVPLETIVAGIGALKSVPGRLERIDCGQSFQAYVDYAHTDDALRRCVLHLRHLTPGRLFCVFGAGGDRDKLKRPLLGKAAAEADVSVVTSDNPRSEEPEKIMRDILVGFAADKPRPHVEPDREQAIRWAIDHAEPGDCVLIAGKGHEVEQIIGTQRLPFDDREVTRTALRDLARPASTSLDRIGA